MHRCGRSPTERPNGDTPSRNENGRPLGRPYRSREERDLAAHHPEAVGAVHGARAGWAERHLGLVAAAGADGIVHLARAPRNAAVATAVAVAAGAAAGGPTLGAAR